MSEPRLAPVPREQWDDDVVEMFRAGIPGPAIDRFLADGPDALRMPNVLSMLAHNPVMSRPCLEFNDYLLRHGTITPRQRELMVLRVGWVTRSEYEWVQHARMAHRFDITKDEVEAIAQGAAAGTWSPVDTALLEATDQLLDHYRIDDATWKVLAEHFDAKQLTEIVFVVGCYTMLSMAFNSLDLQLDPEIENADVPGLPEE